MRVGLIKVHADDACVVLPRQMGGSAGVLDPLLLDALENAHVTVAIADDQSVAGLSVG